MINGYSLFVIDTVMDLEMYLTAILIYISVATRLVKC